MLEESHVPDIDMPDSYRTYYTDLETRTDKIFKHVQEAKHTKADSSEEIEPKIAFDLADRVSMMLEIDVANPLRALLKNNGKEPSALTIAKEIALGKYMPESSTLEERLDQAVRVGLAIVTEGVTVAPLQGISEIKIKKNKDGTEFLSISIAGPMRSAGGTESAVTMLIADYVRQATGLAKYQADSFDDESGRFVEELRIYERDAPQGFQYGVQDGDIITVIKNLPVELAGAETDPFEVVNHKGMKRIETDRVRGGALRVLNDGLIGRSKKMLDRIEKYDIAGWGWLKDLKGAVQVGNDQEDASSKRMKGVITGRSVLSMSDRLGGFRLRYGRACNTGFASVGLHPTIAEILDHTIAVGTQIVTNIPGKGATVAFVDSIETPVVRLKDGSVVKIKDVAHAIKIRPQIDVILHLGDILISFGDFLENNTKLVPSAYVEEYWLEEFKIKLDEYAATDEHLLEFLKRPPTLDEAIKLSLDFGLSLYPQFLYYWDQISHDDFAKILSPDTMDENSITYDASCKDILEALAVPHKITDGKPVLAGDEARVFYNLLFANKITPDPSVPILQTISTASGISVRPKFSISIGVRVGRPEKAAPRQMKPPVHSLFPVTERAGSMRDILKVSSRPNFFTNIVNRICPDCNEPSLGIKCQNCGSETEILYTCNRCHQTTDGQKCPRCERDTVAYNYREFPLKKQLQAAQERVEIRAHEPFKGVRELIGQDKIAEPLEKGLIRQKENLTVFRDGTVRFDATNSPLTHFRPSWIGTSIEKLKELGYTHDVAGRELVDPDQTVELRMQDVIIPVESAKYLVHVCKYIDAELASFYGTSKLYNVHNTDELIGHLIIGLAPHTSVGIVGRIIGYTNTHVCFGTPNWHSAKRRDADGDADSIMMLSDALLNFSLKFLSDKIGGLMDAPLLVQPLVLPDESQSQAHNLEVMKSFPLQFYKDTQEGTKAKKIDCINTVLKRVGSIGMFGDYDFTHTTSILTTSKSRSAYSTLDSMLDKFDMQIKNANMIRAVDANKVVSNLISTHLVPDIMGNLRAYARQKIRCTLCGTSYRRMPLQGKCLNPKCDKKLIQTITRPSVEKYLKMAKRLVEKYDVGEYQRGRIHVLADEIDLVFGKSKGDQTLLSDFTS